MALYLIGDVQGCDAALGACWTRWAFRQPRHAYLLGDLVNRGPNRPACCAG
jgi:bis(5'-nucleosyl)-tetraphosphatase (symmetrical)